MKSLSLGAAFVLAWGAVAGSAAVFAAETPTKIAGPFTMPESVCVGPDGTLYVTEIGQPNTDGDGKVTTVVDGQLKPLVTGLNDPKGIVFSKDALYLTDKNRVLKVTPSGEMSVFLDTSAFPDKPLYLNDIAADTGKGVLLVSDMGDRSGTTGAVYRIDVKSKKVEVIASPETIEKLQLPNGVAFDGHDHALVADMKTGVLYRVTMADQSAEEVASGMLGADGLVWDHYGALFITSWTEGKVYAIPQPGQDVMLIGEGLQSAADACLSADGQSLLIPDMKAGTLNSLPTTIPGWEVDRAPLPVEFALAFPKLQWTGWDDGSETGRVVPLRPIVLTHAGDGSNRVFVATQHGVVHSFAGNNDATKTDIFLDISKKVRYDDKKNEEGFLGLAFHPKFAENGEFFAYYTDANAERESVISRFKVDPNDKTKADPASEEVLMRIEQPFWNHNGGCMLFGPDGYLYITLGDGGSGGDPLENGQNLGTILGSVLRIDVDNKSPGKNYAIPADNPFVNIEGAQPEVYAYGLRNLWRMSFDKATGKLWGGEVGQNLFEEIILIEKGGNYGWNVREGFHPFGPKGVGERNDLIDPIYEYHHDIGKSITGGYVYRGKAIPELQGAYIYADYVATKVWGLKYDEDSKRVVADQPIAMPKLPVLSFGEDEQGEIYALVVSATGQGIYRVTKSAASE